MNFCQPGYVRNHRSDALKAAASSEVRRLHAIWVSYYRDDTGSCGTNLCLTNLEEQLPLPP